MTQVSQNTGSTAYAAALLLSSYQGASLISSTAISASSVSTTTTNEANGAAVLFVSPTVGWLGFLNRSRPLGPLLTSGVMSCVILWCMQGSLAMQWSSITGTRTNNAPSLRVRVASYKPAVAGLVPTRTHIGH